MHLLVLSAFRRPYEPAIWLHGEFGKSQCTFWCSVLSDEFANVGRIPSFESQCTFWCSVLSD